MLIRNRQQRQFTVSLYCVRNRSGDEVAETRIHCVSLTIECQYSIPGQNKEHMVAGMNVRLYPLASSKPNQVSTEGTVF